MPFIIPGRNDETRALVRKAYFWDGWFGKSEPPAQPPRPAVVTPPPPPAAPAAVSPPPMTPVAGMAGDKPYIVARLDTGDVEHGRNINQPVYTASTSKMGLAYLLKDRIPGGTTDINLQRCLSQSHAGTCSFLAAEELHRRFPDKFTAADLKAAERLKNVSSPNAQDIRPDPSKAQEERKDGIDLKIDRMFAPLVNKVLRDELGINTDITNANGGFWKNEKPSTMPLKDMEKIMMALWNKDKGDFLKRHGDPNNKDPKGAWEHTAIHVNKDKPVEGGTHLNAVAPDPEDKASIFFFKTGSFNKKAIGTGKTPIGKKLIGDGYGNGVFMRVVGFKDKEGHPHMAYVAGSSSNEVNRNTRLAINSVRHPSPSLAPRPERIRTETPASPPAASPPPPPKPRTDTPPRGDSNKRDLFRQFFK